MAEVRNKTLQQHATHIPAWMKGMIGGVSFWLLMWLGAELANVIIFVVLAAPVAVLGWMFVWGDNGPPYEWLNSLTFHVGFALILYGLIGALLGRWLGE